MIKVQRDNVVLSIDESNLGQYEARGYQKVGTKKEATKEELRKEIERLSKANQELTKKLNKKKGK